MKHNLLIRYLATLFLLIPVGCKPGTSNTPQAVSSSPQVSMNDYLLFTHTPGPTDFSGLTDIPLSGELTTTPESANLVPSTPTITPTYPYPCTPELCTLPGHFWMKRPISPQGNDQIDSSYRYGSTQEGARPTHHGVEFVNPEGTPVLAAAEGLVIVAGNDFQETYADFPFYYGNLVIIEHHFPGIEVPVFSLYGHLSNVETQMGNYVQAGDQIGSVGYTGVAEWSHLHFEIRVMNNLYKDTRNPELWLKPHQIEDGELNGAIAGRLVDEFGTPIYIPNIVIERIAPGNVVLETFYAETYADFTVSGDDDWGENFVIGDLIPGEYRVSFVARGLQVREMTVYPGQLTLLTFDARDL